VEVVSLDYLLFIELQFAHISIIFTFLYNLLFFTFDKSFDFFFFFGFPLF
jgi:hypothetical protein